MKIVFNNSSMEFRPAYPSGTEIQVTPDYSGTYDYGSGYYLTSDGKLEYLKAYAGKLTGISNLISVLGFSKIRVTNIQSNPYHGVLSFFNNNEQINGYYTKIYNDPENVPGTIEFDIPEDVLYIRAGSNSTDYGGQPLGPAIITLIV